jgi:hypothetical protein
MDRTESFSALTCPMCGGSLKEGYLVPGRGLAWTPLRARFPLGADYEWLSKPFQLRYVNFLARRGTDCRLILFRYP